MCFFSNFTVIRPIIWCIFCMQQLFWLVKVLYYVPNHRGECSKCVYKLKSITIIDQQRYACVCFCWAYNLCFVLASGWRPSQLTRECLICVVWLRYWCRNEFYCDYVLCNCKWLLFLVTKMNYDAERAMNQKRLRMEGEPGHGVVQGNGLPLNYIGKWTLCAKHDEKWVFFGSFNVILIVVDNGHQIPYQPYAGAYNTHYPPPEAFSPYGPPPPGGYAPQNLSYAPPAHQNYPHHQSFPPQQPPQAQLHMPQSHMGE